MIHGSAALIADKLDFESVSFVSPNDDRNTRKDGWMAWEVGRKQGSVQGYADIQLRAEI